MQEVPRSTYFYHSRRLKDSEVSTEWQQSATASAYSAAVPTGSKRPRYGDSFEQVMSTGAETSASTNNEVGGIILTPELYGAHYRAGCLSLTRASNCSAPVNKRSRFKCSKRKN
ncbi:hypothetical protein AN958_02734 [Leucoagaricus sp. SymC.cos]|nr:hypothetical protein AN958_02734 [Leucoagaricus sp. SymC.cos]